MLVSFVETGEFSFHRFPTYGIYRIHPSCPDSQRLYCSSSSAQCKYSDTYLDRRRILACSDLHEFKGSVGSQTRNQIDKISFRWVLFSRIDFS